MALKYPRGAEWRKWDLHLHTPASYDYENKSVTNEDIIDAIVKNGISVVAITDHHIIDVQRIRELQQIGVAKGVTVLPGIEFLSDARGSEPVHFIGIFSEDCKLDYIWGQLQNKTAISRILSESKKPNGVYCDLIDTTSLVHELGGIVTVHSGQKHGSVETITNSLQHTMAQKEDIARSVDFYELGKPEDQKGYIEVVFPFIKKRLPMVIGSDNHNINDYKLKVNCWLKADPLFDGLKQVAIEPEGRVFIGEKPSLLDRLSKNRTKYIKELEITQAEGYDERYGVWFKNVSVPLNSELVAIIGNKGSGKSAIADVIALCSNYPSGSDFSFLTPEKFKKKRLAENFNAAVVWESGKVSKINLQDQSAITDLLDVKYLPQGQFERLTNEIRTVEEFQNEIEGVVFSHIPDSERLGTLSFGELIEKTTSSANLELEMFKGEIREINKKIIELERKSTTAYRSEIENKLKKKQEELAALVEPPPVSDPNEDPEKKIQNETVNNKINELKENIQKLQTAVQAAEDQKKNALETLQLLKTIKSDVRQKEIEIGKFISEKELELTGFNVDVKKLVTIQTDFTELDALIFEKEDSLQKAKELLGEVAASDESTPLPEQLAGIEAHLKVERSKLDIDQQQYQQYLTNKDSWHKLKDAIIGSVGVFDTIDYYKVELEYLSASLNDELESKYEDRRVVVRSIFDKKHEIIAVYKDARNRLNAIIEENQDTLKDYKIEVDASLVKKGDFNTRFLDLILQNKMGTFHSKEGGEAQLIGLLTEIDFDEKEDVISLLNNIVNALRFDKRSGQKNTPRAVSDQVKDIQALYNYLFILGFLDNNYQLKQGDKEFEQLSPGERGALLLVFYLLLDKNDIPLVIDQPEDNLDNHSVATILVPFIRAAKKKRQIIMVTHNPNLAVVSDAEQVIYVGLDKESNYTFSTVSGSIEDKEVNKKIVDVLEGAMPAFNMRKLKYYE
ncbi:MAG: AAA family ATPase [Desulfuromonadales bacterium]|nr:AAA family ATPase [Desulfuromonadales bacterium]